MGTRLAPLLAALLLAGCSSPFALFYSHTTRPLTTDFAATPVADGRYGANVRMVSFYVDVEWGDNGLGAIAKKNGIAEIYYADVQTVSVFRYFRQDYVRVYGRLAEGGEGVATGGVTTGGGEPTTLPAPQPAPPAGPQD